MFATKHLNRPAAAASISLALALGATVLASALPVAAAALPRFSIHVDAPRVTGDSILRIAPGMSQSDVEGAIGSPHRTGRFPLSHTLAWDYDYRDAWGYDSTFSVIFDDAGSVVSKISVRNEY